MEFFPISVQTRVAFHALSLEAAPVRAPGWSVIASRSARIEAKPDTHTLLRFETGVGKQAVLRRVAMLPPWRFDRALLGGFAGALDPTLEPGTVVVGDPLVDREGRMHAVPLAAEIEACARRAGLRVKRGVLTSVDRVVADAQSKRALAAATGACAVDMESVALAEYLAGRSIPFGVGRVILDCAHEALPPSASVAAGLREIVRRGGLSRVVGFARIGFRTTRCARVGSRLVESWLDASTP